MADFPFVLISESEATDFPTISDSLFDAAARGIRFKVNRTELQPYDPFIAIFREQLVPWLKAHDMQLRRVYVRGAASPEGPYDNNVRLSRERTQRLIDFLNECMEESDTTAHPVCAQSITEDYGLLVKMMRERGDRDYERVHKLWLDCAGDELRCKMHLKSIDHGLVWNRLLQEYFPALRQARVILCFALKSQPRPEPVDTPQAVAAQPTVQPEEPATNMVQEAPLRYERRHLLAVRSNLLHDLLYVPQFGWAYGVNIQLEYYPLKGRYTYNAGFTFTNHRHWDDHKAFQIRDLQLELRRYFKGGGKFIGTYLAAYIEGTVYGIGFSSTKGWQGEGGGGGLTLGHTCRLNRKGSLRLEASLSLGFFISRYDPYIYNHPYVGYDDGRYYYDYFGNADNFKKRNHQFTWFGPTNAGLHITYDILYRKKKPVGYYEQKGGAQ